jgi:hypothetical protein
VCPYGGGPGQEPASDQGRGVGAGDGNRTRMTSLEAIRTPHDLQLCRAR